MTETKIEILRAARKSIADGSESFVCYAISRESLWHESSFKRADAGYELRLWVQDMLGKLSTYDGWLSFHHQDFFRSIPTRDDGSKDLRPGRLQWIDWMISELEREA